MDNVVTISSLLAQEFEVLAHVSVREMTSIKTVVNTQTGDQYYWFSQDWSRPDARYLVVQLTRKDGTKIRGRYCFQRLEDRPAAKPQSKPKKPSQKKTA